MIHHITQQQNKMYTHKLPMNELKALSVCDRAEYDLAMSRKRSADYLAKHDPVELKKKRQHKAAMKRLLVQQQCNNDANAPVFLAPLIEPIVPVQPVQPVQPVVQPVATATVAPIRQMRPSTARQTAASAAPAAPQTVATATATTTAPKQKPPRKQRADHQITEVAHVKDDFTSEELIDEMAKLPVFLKNGEPINQGSFTTYRTSIRKFFKLSGDCNTIFACLKGGRYVDIIHKIRDTNTDEVATNTKKLVYQALLYALEHVLQPFMDENEYTKMHTDIHNEHSNADFIAREDHIWKMLNEKVPTINAYLKKVLAAYGHDSKEYLLCYLYTIFTCRDNYKSMYLLDSEDYVTEDTKNYMILNNTPFCQIVLTEYKTKKNMVKLNTHCNLIKKKN